MLSISVLLNSSTFLPILFAYELFAEAIFSSRYVIKPTKEFTLASIFERCLIFLNNGFSNVCADQFFNAGTFPKSSTTPFNISPGKILNG